MDDATWRELLYPKEERRMEIALRLLGRENVSHQEST